MTLLLILTTLVQSVQSVNVILAHLAGLAEGHVAVGDGQHSRLVVLGEGVPGKSKMLELDVLSPNIIPHRHWDTSVSKL